MIFRAVAGGRRAESLRKKDNTVFGAPTAQSSGAFEPREAPDTGG